MIEKSPGTGKIRSQRVRHTCSISEALESFFGRHKGRGNFKLPYLWENWGMVMGENLSYVAQPLGVHDKTLIIGAEDSMLMHELSFCTPEIMARANAFLDEEYFCKVRVELLRDRIPLYPPVAARPKEQTVPEPRPRPDNLGQLLGVLDPDSPVGKAYLSYVKSFEGE